MESVVLVVHLIFALSIIGLVLLQRSEGGGLGIGGGGGLGGFASAKGTANALTKMTALCAAGFFITSLTLGVLASQHSKQTTGLLENIDESKIEAPISNDNDISAPVGITYTPPEKRSNPEASNETKEDTPEDTQNENLGPPKKSNKTVEEPSAPIE